tara:strand:- start:12200 stop:13555 length:1356 start_codon:yes stop_codon:yes gene_type:complete
MFKSLIHDENNSDIFMNISISLVVKGIALFVNILMLPYMLIFFHEKEIAGIWFTFMSITSWVLMFDLGIGSGLRNYLTSAFALNNQEKIKRYITSSYYLVGFISLFLYIILRLINGLVDWNSMLSIDSSIIGADILTQSIHYIIISISVHIFLKLVVSIFNSLQKTALSSILVLCSNILFLFVLVYSNNNEDAINFINLSYYYIFTINLPMFIATIVLFSSKLSYAIPNIIHFSYKDAVDIIKLGGMFFWIQLTFMFIASTNEVVIIWLFNPEYVVEYQVYNRFFYAFVMLFSLISSPVWSATTKAFSQKKFEWIRSVYKNLIFFSLIFMAICFLFIMPFQSIVDVWLGSNSIEINYFTAFIFVVFCSVVIFNFCITSIANGLGELKYQLFGYSIGVLLKFPLCYLISKIYVDLDWILVIYVNIIILTPYIIWQAVALNFKLKNNNKESYV